MQASRKSLDGVNKILTTTRQQSSRIVLQIQATSNSAYLKGVENYQADILSITCIQPHILRLVDFRT